MPEFNYRAYPQDNSHKIQTGKVSAPDFQVARFKVEKMFSFPVSVIFVDGEGNQIGGFYDLTPEQKLEEMQNVLKK